MPPTVRLTAERFGAERANLTFGWIFTAHQLGAATAAFGAGFSRSDFATYLPALYVAGVACVIAAGLVLTIGRRPEGSARAGVNSVGRTLTRSIATNGGAEGVKAEDNRCLSRNVKPQSAGATNPTIAPCASPKRTLAAGSDQKEKNHRGFGTRTGITSVNFWSGPLPRSRHRSGVTPRLAKVSLS